MDRHIVSHTGSLCVDMYVKKQHRGKKLSHITRGVFKLIHATFMSNISLFTINAFLGYQS